jgi:hypothetical protein
MSKKNIFLTVSHGFHVRNFMETKFIDGLSDAYNVIMVINDADKVSVKKFIADHNLSIEVEGIVIQKRRFEDRFIFFRKNIFVNPKRAGTKNILNELHGKELGHWRSLFSLFNKIFGRFEFSRASWRRFERFFITGHEFDKLLRKHNPCLVITANYGTEPFEIRLLRSAKRHQIKTLAIIPSWDNLTSKGVMGVKPDYLVVWNEIMAREAEELHAFKKENVFVTGPLQFDNFFDPDFLMSRDEFNAKFQVENGRPLIVFGTITPKYFKYNIEVLKILREFIKNGDIKGNPKILIRIHPQVVKDPVYGDNLEEYRLLALENDTFALSIPETEEWASMTIPSKTDYRELISALTYAKICIASASTLIFDSFACNTCFIGIGFDGEEKQIPYHKSVKRMFDFEHYKNVRSLGGFYVAESKRDLANYINSYLTDPGIHKEERAKTLNQHIKFFDGKNYQRVIAAINQVNL